MFLHFFYTAAKIQSFLILVKKLLEGSEKIVSLHPNFKNAVPTAEVKLQMNLFGV
jgi:hypothetical protein